MECHRFWLTFDCRIAFCSSLLGFVFRLAFFLSILAAHYPNANQWQNLQLATCLDPSASAQLKHIQNLNVKKVIPKEKANNKETMR